MTSSSFRMADLPPLKLSHLAWFEGEDAADGSGLGCNHDYRDLRGLTPADLRFIVDWESRELELRLQSAALCDGCEDGCPQCEAELEGLELGVASAVVALSVIGCIPYTSCNGGRFGGAHVAEVLIVGFYVRPALVAQIREAAARAGVGLTNDRCGGLYVLTDEPRDMMSFAVALGGLSD